MLSFSGCLSLVLVVATPAMAVAGPADGQPAVADERSAADRLGSLLVVRVDVEMEGGEAVAEALREELLTTLLEAGVPPELPEGAPLELVVSANEESVGTYEVVYVHRGRTLDAQSCPCSGDELRAQLRRTTPDAWRAAIAAAAPPAEPEPAPTVPVAPVDPGPAMGEPGHGMWIAGVATTALGTGLAVSMSVRLILDATDGKAVSGLNIGLWATGAAMAATGAVLWSHANLTRKRAYLGLGPSRGRGLAVILGGRF